MDFNAARKNMVDCQIRTNKVVDETILLAMETVPRERFVPDHLQSLAYIDEDLGIAPDRYLMEPLVLARLLQEIGVLPSDVVLVIGSGAGYAAALLARMAATVFAQESDPDLSARAAGLFAELALDNVVPVDGPLPAGCPEHAPFNVILIEGAVDSIPDAITGQLADGGRLVTVVQDGRIGRATVVTSRAGHISRRTVFDASVPPLADFRAPAGFVF